MSLSHVNAKGKIIYSSAAPKATDGGADLSKNATNSKGKISKTKENGPSASCMAADFNKSNKY